MDDHGPAAMKKVMELGWEASLSFAVQLESFLQDHADKLRSYELCRWPDCSTWPDRQTHRVTRLVALVPKEKLAGGSVSREFAEHSCPHATLAVHIAIVPTGASRG